MGKVNRASLIQAGYKEDVACAVDGEFCTEVYHKKIKDKFSKSELQVTFYDFSMKAGGAEHSGFNASAQETVKIRGLEVPIRIEVTITDPGTSILDVEYALLMMMATVRDECCWCKTIKL